jgi:hypothetical protein
MVEERALCPDSDCGHNMQALGDWMWGLYFCPFCDRMYRFQAVRIVDLNDDGQVKPETLEVPTDD